MPRRGARPSWAELLAKVGRSTFDLLGAELRGAGTELAELWVAVRGLAMLGALAAALGFFALAALLVAAVAVLSLWLPVWGAALTVFGALLGVAGMLALLIRARLAELRSPVDILRQRAVSHAEFWRTQVLGDVEVGGSTGPAGAVGVGSADLEEDEP